ncbi:proteasome assembly chaperone family protein [Candidatus Bathyarchaeota archaeon]|nr:MAG: proteasome assembly chaperone family protein [Candidatus Bathyarchaeota archaeon]
MTVHVRLLREPELRDPVLIEGLPGVGLVANLAAAQLIQRWEAEKFAELYSSTFQSLTVTTRGGFSPPLNELYAHRGSGRDAIILFGNTQASTPRGQYELSGRVLDLAQGLGCRLVVTLGGMKVARVQGAEPRIFCAATDGTTLSGLDGLGFERITGRITGAAGLLLGLAGIRGMRGFCLLAETEGKKADPVAASAVLDALVRTPTGLSMG